MVAFELYASGQYSLNSLRVEMATRGLAKRSGQPISKGCIEKFLGNPFYTCVIRIKKTGEVFQGAHERLISANLFENVQKVRAGKCGKKVTRHNHMYRGLFRCGHCDRAMIPELQKGNVYYRCQYPVCPKNSIREEPLSRAINRVLEICNLSEQCIVAIEQRAEHWSKKYSNATNHQTKAMQFAQIDEQLEKLEDAAIDKIIDADSFAKRKEKLLLKKAGVQKLQSENERYHQTPAVIRNFLERLKNLGTHYYNADPAEKRVIVEIATSNRSVKDKNVYIEPANWLLKAQHAMGVLYCAESRTNSRTCTKNEEQHMEQLAEAARSPEMERLYEMFMDDYKKAGNLFQRYDR